MDLYVSIVKGVKKINYCLQDLYGGNAMNVKNQQLFMRPICQYRIFEMTLWKLK
jgi:hypothetical protein